MKRKIIIGLSIILFIFFIGALFIVYTLETSRTKFNRIIHLHQVQIIRDNLLLNLEKAQSDIYLRGTRFAQEHSALEHDAAALESAINGCFTCHHSQAMNNRLIEAKDLISLYRARINDVLADRGGTHIEDKENEAISIGNRLLTMFYEMVNFANIRLQAKTVGVSQDVTTVEISLYVIMALGFLTAAFVAFRLQRQSTEPLGELLKGAEHFSQGDLDYRIPETMPRELSLVAGSFNKMAAELKGNIEKMKKTEQSDIMREIAAGLAHEIKNPLTGIKGALEVFSRELSLSKEDRAVFEEMLFQVKKLDVMTKCFLEYARPPSPQVVPVAINDVIHNTISFVTRQNLHKNLQQVTVIEDYDRTMPLLQVDPMQIQQVLLNLIFNALDAMPEGGILKFKTSQQNGTSLIQVSDSGHGIDDETMNNIFKPFFTTKAKGMGIGLSISRRLIEQHDGEISATSGAKGTTFTIKLPGDRSMPDQELRQSAN